MIDWPSVANLNRTQSRRNLAMLFLMLICFSQLLLIMIFFVYKRPLYHPQGVYAHTSDIRRKYDNSEKTKVFGRVVIQPGDASSSSCPPRLVLVPPDPPPRSALAILPSRPPDATTS